MTQIETTKADKALMTRVLWRLMPLLVLSLVVSTIDKSNVGFAKLGMLEDLGFTEAVFAFGASLFFVGYVLFEIPSAMANYKYGARIWFARIMVTWAITTLLLTFTQSPAVFYTLRFLLGAAEAGLYPALIFYLTLWFPESERPRAMGVLTLGSAFGNGFSALISGALLDLDGVLNLAGWQWIFIVTGLMPVVTTVLVLMYLPNSPDDARFLNVEEKQRIKTLLGDRPEAGHRGGALASLLDPRVIGFGLMYGIFLGSVYGISYWMPTVLRDFGVSGSVNGLIIGIPWALDAILLMIIMPRLRSQRAIMLALIALAVVAILAFGAAASWGGLALKGAALLIGIPALSIGIACYWTIPVRYFSGAKAAASIGAISMIGNMGGVATLNLMPALAAYSGSPSAALWVPSIGMAVIGVWAAWVSFGRRRAVA
ncbi:MFS transporter [Sphingomonas soli]|uniref:MFS transporter n=1 Tax=Sphingomonas soli TaxID=266127 RepID=UPI000B1DED59|nr:MFS transporter [Sphingomonas soli]